MTSVVNDENQEPCPESKHVDSVLDSFALDQPTGRPSILRQSENLPSKTVAKGVKVCFQTPRRDPVTKRIVSPSKTGKITTVEECTKAMESLQVTEPVDKPKIELSPNPDDIPIQSKGGYNFDFDNLDAINPFQASIKVPNSPTRPALEDIPGTKVPQCGTPETVSGEIAQTETVLDDTLPITPSMENSLANMSTDVHSTDSSVVTVSKGTAGKEQDSSCNMTDEETPAAMSFTVIPEEATANFSVEDAPLPPKGAYNLDFDLESVNPFMTGSKIPNSPQVEKKVPCRDPPVEESVESVDVPAKLVATVVSDTPKLTEDDFMSQPNGAPLKVMESVNGVAIPEKPVATAISDTPKSTEDEFMSQSQPDGAPLKVMESVNDVAIPEKPVATAVSDTPKPTEDESVFQSTDAPLNEGPVKLEFNFDDGCNVKRKPPPKRFSKKPPGLKSTEKKPAPEKKEPTPPKESPVKPVADDNMAPIPKSSYSFQFDDPNFNPFGTKAKMNNSLTCGEMSIPVGKSPTPVNEIPTPIGTGDGKDDIRKIGGPTPVAGKDDIQKIGGPTPVALKENVTSDEKTEIAPDLVFLPETELPVLGAPEFITLGHLDQNAQTGLPDPSEEFVPGTMFMANDFDGQMDYLEQCGTGSFKESALRKQSLYLKFDPLMKESPKKPVGPGTQNPIPRLAPFVSRLEAPQMADTKAAKSKEDFKLVDVVAATVDPFVQNSDMHVCRVAPLPQPTDAEDAIVEMLKYSQKDMDKAIAFVQTEANEKDKQWKAKYDKLFEECEDKKRIISELETSSAKMQSAQEKDHQKTATSLRESLRVAVQEKEQAQTELSNLERSFSEVLKRLDKYKEVIASCRKNEETLKACAQDALARIRKEEQRYQTLKTHAEEKIEMANKQIFEVRSKFKAEMVGLQAQLRLEQMKAQSLEKSLDQKGKEFEELNKVCDELISNVQRS